MKDKKVFISKGAIQLKCNILEQEANDLSILCGELQEANETLSSDLEKTKKGVMCSHQEAMEHIQDFHKNDMERRFKVAESNNEAFVKLIKRMR